MGYGDRHYRDDRHAAGPGALGAVGAMIFLLALLITLLVFLVFLSPGPAARPASRIAFAVFSDPLFYVFTFFVGMAALLWGLFGLGSRG